MTVVRRRHPRRWPPGVKIKLRAFLVTSTDTERVKDENDLLEIGPQELALLLEEAPYVAEYQDPKTGRWMSSITVTWMSSSANTTARCAVVMLSSRDCPSSANSQTPLTLADSARESAAHASTSASLARAACRSEATTLMASSTASASTPRACHPRVPGPAAGPHVVSAARCGVHGATAGRLRRGACRSLRVGPQPAVSSRFASLKPEPRPSPSSRPSSRGATWPVTTRCGTANHTNIKEKLLMTALCTAGRP